MSAVVICCVVLTFGFVFITRLFYDRMMMIWTTITNNQVLLDRTDLTLNNSIKCQRLQTNNPLIKTTNLN